MQVNKSLKLLKKINSVFSTIIEDTESVSALEKELLKSYVVRFYDTLMDKEENTVSKQQDLTSEVKRPVAVPHVPPVAQKQPIPQEIQPQVEPPKKVAVAAEEIIAPPTNGKVTHEQPSEAQTKTETVVIETSGDLLSGIMEEITSSQHNSHIGERLISDLKKSMGLNDKLRYANDLFGGNQSRLLETLEKLNTAPNLEANWGYLNDLAKEFDWLEASRVRSTTNFLSLVNRKYNAS